MFRPADPSSRSYCTTAECRPLAKPLTLARRRNSVHVRHWLFRTSVASRSYWKTSAYDGRLGWTRYLDVDDFSLAQLQGLFGRTVNVYGIGCVLLLVYACKSSSLITTRLILILIACADLRCFGQLHPLVLCS